MSKNIRRKIAQMVACGVFIQATTQQLVYTNVNIASTEGAVNSNLASTTRSAVLVSNVTTAQAIGATTLSTSTIDLASLENGVYTVNVDIFQQYADTDSMCAGFVKKDDVKFIMKDGIATVTMHIAKNPQLGEYIYEDTIGDTEYRESDGETWVLVDRTLTQEIIQYGEPEDAWEFEVISESSEIYVRAVIGAMGNTNPAFRVIFNEITSFTPEADILDDGSYSANISILQTSSDSVFSRYSGRVTPTEVIFSVVDGEANLNLNIDSTTFYDGTTQYTVREIAYLDETTGDYISVDTTSGDDVLQFTVPLIGEEITIEATGIRKAMFGSTVANTDYFRIVLSDMEPFDTAVIEDVEISIDATTFFIGESVSIVGAVYPEETTLDATLTWSSSNENVASINDGVVKGDSPGSTTITATAVNDVFDLVEITIANVAEGTSYADAENGEYLINTVVWRDDSDADSSMNTEMKVEDVSIEIIDGTGFITMEFRQHAKGFADSLIAIRAQDENGDWIDLQRTESMAVVNGTEEECWKVTVPTNSHIVPIQLGVYAMSGIYNQSHGIRVVVTDQDASTQDVTIDDVIITYPSTETSADGAIKVDASGADNMIYSINNGETWSDSNTFTDLVLDSYTVRIADRLNITNYTTQTVTLDLQEPEEVSFSTDGMYKADAVVWQEYSDTDSMMATAVKTTDIDVEVESNIANVTLHIAKDALGYTDSINKLSYQNNDGQWVECEMVTTTAVINETEQSAWEIVVPTSTETMLLQVDIDVENAYSATHNVRVILTQLDYISVLPDLEYSVNLNVWKEYEDEDSMAAAWVGKTNVPVSRVDGSTTLTTYIEKNPSLSDVTYYDAIGDVYYKDANGDWVEVEKVAGQIGDMEVWYLNIPVHNVYEDIYLLTDLDLGTFQHPNTAFRLVYTDEYEEDIEEEDDVNDKDDDNDDDDDVNDKDDDNDDEDEDELTVDIDYIVLEIGASQTITANSNNVTWSSADENIATVTAEGEITAVGAGTTTITVTADNGNIATVTVTVTQPIEGAGDLADLTNGVYTTNISVLQEYTDADSMCASFIKKDNVKFSMEDGIATVTMHIAKDPNLGGNVFEDTIGDIEYRDADELTWVLVEKTLTQEVIQYDEPEDAWEFEVLTQDSEIYVRATIGAMGNTNPAFRVIMGDITPFEDKDDEDNDDEDDNADDDSDNDNDEDSNDEDSNDEDNNDEDNDDEDNNADEDNNDDDDNTDDDSNDEDNDDEDDSDDDNNDDDNDEDDNAEDDSDDEDDNIDDDKDAGDNNNDGNVNEDDSDDNSDDDNGEDDNSDDDSDDSNSEDNSNDDGNTDDNNNADTIAPVFSYTGASSYTLLAGTTFSIPEVTATDNVDGEITVTTSITKDGVTVTAVDTSTVGTYVITYLAQDSASNTATMSITVRIIYDSFDVFNFSISYPSISFSSTSTTSTSSTNTTTTTTSTAEQNLDNIEITELLETVLEANEEADVESVTQTIAEVFTDISESAWYYADVSAVYNSGLMAGVTDTEWEPATTVTRAQLATILHRMDDNLVINNAQTFSDIANDAWYSTSINWAASVGIYGGYDDGTFRPSENITREQIAVIIYNYAGYKNYDTMQSSSLADFNDVNDIASWSSHAVAWAVGNGIIGGRDDGTLDPKGTATRAEIAVIINRLLNLN
ncbi:MAG: hypothetical protein BEN18_05605 [Epulopiscium sp. Nuni2H_MBin001]|nr:MAG: hypothetical protein BEN18_05605 [Epulopiscium sp. Nuni2H_MBin001]